MNGFLVRCKVQFQGLKISCFVTLMYFKIIISNQSLFNQIELLFVMVKESNTNNDSSFSAVLYDFKIVMKHNIIL